MIMTCSRSHHTPVVKSDHLHPPFTWVDCVMMHMAVGRTCSARGRQHYVNYKRNTVVCESILIVYDWLSVREKKVALTRTHVAWIWSPSSSTAAQPIARELLARLEVRVCVQGVRYLLSLCLGSHLKRFMWQIFTASDESRYSRIRLYVCL